MILQSLVQYYETMERQGKATRPGWSNAKVSFALEIALDGQLKRVIPLKEEKKPQIFIVPQMVTRSSGVSSNFLCDNSSYLLGVDNKGKPDRSLECFQCAKEKHREILGDIDSVAGQAILKYFDNWKPEEAEKNPALVDSLDEIMAGANLVFWIEDNYAQNVTEIKDAWERYYNASTKEPDGICLVTGKKAEIARIHANIKGLQGAQSSGAAIVSFNAPSFESYGKEQSFNAPVGTYAVYAYTTALNTLLADKKHATTIGDMTILYWSEDGDEACQDLFFYSSEPTRDNYEIVNDVFKNLETGKAVHVDGVEKEISLNQKFYILGLSPNAARIAVRFFYQDSFGNILNNIRAHYNRMEIVRPSNDTLQYLGAWRMLMETANRKSKDKKPIPNVAGTMYRAIISGSRYPDALYQSVLSRIRAEQDDEDAGTYKITRGRAAIIKAFLLKNRGYDKEGITVALNEDSTNAAYTLGRLFSILEEIQEVANPNINATIKDRYFNAACATPASIFPILFKLKNSHTRKFSSKGMEINYETKLTELQGKIEGYPKRLSLEEQGMFILGYYHQTQKR